MTFPGLSSLDGALKRRILWGLVVALAVFGAGDAWKLIHFQPLGVDFLPLWTAGRMVWSPHAPVYDFAAVTHAQDWLLPGFRWMRPFAYPPTALLLLAPFGALPFWPALSLWLGLSVAAFVYAGRRLAGDREGLALILMLLSPAVLLAAMVGQSVILAAALVTLAMVDLKQHPRRAGVWLALAAAIKPQAVLLAPVALLAGGAVETLVSAAVVGSLILALSVAVFGVGLWSQWLAVLPAFDKVILATPGLPRWVITPQGAAIRLGLTGAASLIWRTAFGLFGAGLAWMTFARATDPARRLAALGAGSLLVAPYAMPSDAAVLVPAAVAIAIGRLETPGWLAGVLALGAVCAVTTPGVGLVCVLAFAVLTGFDLAGLRSRSPAAVAAR